ncbi:hypothetical protein [Enterococcus sp. LJL51]|uniref:hypothetical protein n=1 Tax=Enterococcus sp. LJL51 TaxID=3416656 RepID=UPI003CE9ABC4
MKNSYIAKSVRLEELKKYSTDIVEVDKFEIVEDMVLVFYSTKEESMENAILLDEINTKIKLNMDEIYLTSCGSSEYFNKKLFKLINKMERKLREFVYIAIIKSDEGRFYDLHGELEKLDFGELYRLLFTDEKFITGTKTIVNKNKNDKSKFILDGSFSKEEVLKVIGEIEENTIWDKINGGNSIPLLKNNFSEIKKFRNNVMHAHNINKATYAKASELFVKLNEDFDLEIKQMLTQNDLYPIGVDFTNSLKVGTELILSATKSIPIESVNRATKALGDLAVVTNSSIDLAQFTEALKSLGKSFENM